MRIRRKTLRKLEKGMIYAIIVSFAVMLPLFCLKLYFVWQLEPPFPLDKKLWDWPYDLLIYALGLMLFLLLFLFRRETGAGSKSVLAAFFVSFVVEMYGFAYSVYLVTALLGNTGIGELYLRDGLPAATWGPFHIRLPFLVIPWALGLVFVVKGWRGVWAGRGELVTRGIYRLMRHPQYFGFWLIMTGTLMFFPTPFLVLGYVVLLAMYWRLSRREERAMLERFGERYERYMREVGPFWPRWRDQPADEAV